MNYQGEKCMACEAGEIDENDYCDNCGCLMVSDLDIDRACDADAFPNK